MDSRSNDGVHFETKGRWTGCLNRYDLLARWVLRVRGTFAVRGLSEDIQSEL